MIHLETFLRAAWLEAEQNGEFPAKLDASVDIVDDKVMLTVAYGERSHTFEIKHSVATEKKK